MAGRITEDEADRRLATYGLEPLEPYAGRDVERRCRCLRCGTTRWVKLGWLRPDRDPCRWCHGWTKWTAWGEWARDLAATWRPVDGSPVESLRKLDLVGLVPLTPPGDEFTPIGFLCPACGETGVTVPERIGDGERGYYGCPRCSQERTAARLERAPAVYEANGLRLLGRCRGAYVPQAAVCVTCGTERTVSLAALEDGNAPLCWTCTHGIRPDEPHRIYLVHFPALRAMKVGLTHARHDRRLADHEFVGGTVLDVVTVDDRATARRVEQRIKRAYAPWATTGLSVVELPQGGWTETWADAAPPLDLRAAVTAALAEA